MFLQSFNTGFATALNYQAASGIFGSNQGRLGLANTANAGMTMPQVATLQQQDKALELQGVQSKTNYEVSIALQDAAEQRRKKESERRQAAINNGFLF